ELYRGDLLPSESKNDFINQARNEYRARLVDALVAASTRLFEHGELQASMWFAHAGVRRDSTREDAYTALMRAQIATGQRTAALDTYFRCKSFLSDELGIDPSPQAMTLYQTIIAAEPNLSSFQPKTSLHS
ncbi:MAG: bacterial transcriptional activator domain-containing protein, partial [Raoultibacter sp.]